MRVAFADDSYLMREAIGQMLASDPRVELVGVYCDGDVLLAAVEEHHPRS